MNNAESPTGESITGAAYGSDLVVDLLKLYGIEYVSLNPGASFRGLHDSLVNYGGNKPEIIECPHEKVAVMMAHGYARAAGKPMAAILHDLVGLLHGAMGLYYAFVDEVPVIVLGGAGPMDTQRRRPYIDWIHSAQNQGDLVRDYTKWDDQPRNAINLADSFSRAYRVAMTEPAGPVYIGLDVNLQEDPLTEKVSLLNLQRLNSPSSISCSPETVDQIAQMLLKAKRPVVLAESLGRHPESVASLIKLAEALALPVIDLGRRFNFPNTHDLDLTGSDILREADLVLALDVKGLHAAITEPDGSGVYRSIIPKGCKVIDIGLRDLNIKAWAQNFDKLPQMDLSVTADTSTVLPQLLLALQDIGVNDKEDKFKDRFQAMKSRHDSLRQHWNEQAKIGWNDRPISTARLAYEIWNVVKGEDWVLTGNPLSGWPRRLWDWTKPYQYPGVPLGAATELSLSLGVALAYRGSDKLVVAIEPDGDLLYDASALWIATHHNLPMLMVMHNNRAYYNDWDHQEVVARHRKRPEENAYLGMEINNPPPDFARLAQSFGWYAEGPIDDPNQVGPALKRALKVIKEKGQPALIDTVTQFR